MITLRGRWKPLVLKKIPHALHSHPPSGFLRQAEAVLTLQSELLHSQPAGAGTSGLNSRDSQSITNFESYRYAYEVD